MTGGTQPVGRRLAGTAARHRRSVLQTARVDLVRLNDAEKWSSRPRAPERSRRSLFETNYSTSGRDGRSVHSPPRGRSLPTAALRGPAAAAESGGGGGSRRASISFRAAPRSRATDEFFFSLDEQTERGQCGDQRRLNRQLANVSGRCRIGCRLQTGDTISV